MHILLFILYSALGAYAIIKLPFFRNSGLRPATLLALFALHVSVGCLHNIISWRFYPHHGDIWTYYENSILTQKEILTDFHAFLRDNSTWNFFTHNSLININIVLNLFSRENLYINTLLFSFPVFLGTTALFRVFRRHFPHSMLSALTVYLLPSALFWTSCIHREAALFMLLGFFFYSLDKRSTPYSILTFLLIAYFRSAVALTLIPALATWWLLTTKPNKRLLLAGSIGVILIAILASPLVLKVLAHQQQEFQILEGHSRITLPIMDGSLAGFLRTLPAALFNGWLEPLPGAGGQTIYTAFSFELLLIWAILLLALAIRRQSPTAQATIPAAPSPTAQTSYVSPATPSSQATTVHDTTVHDTTTPASFVSPATPSPQATANAAPRDYFSVCCILFALSSMLLIGLIVPFIGTIVRYRSIYLPFLLAPALHRLRSTSFLRRFDDWINLTL